MDFILEIPNLFHRDVCEDMIKRFEKDDGKAPGVAGPNLKLVPSFKSSMDLFFSEKPEWEDVVKYTFNKTQQAYEIYKDHLNTKGLVESLEYVFRDSYDMGYHIKKTTKGEYYNWHNDGLSKESRFLTFIIYLNDLNPIYEGGGTTFHPTVGGGKVITPEQGKMLIFPATWTYYHMGLPIVSDKPKYICVGQLCSKNI